MKKIVVLILAATILSAAWSTVVWSEKPASGEWGKSKSVATKAVEFEVPLKPTPATAVPKLSIRERRAMGLTFRNVRKQLSVMKKAGELEGKDVSTISVEVLNRLVQDNPKAFSNPKLDWDNILSFLEKLIPLILKIMMLFGL